MYKSQITNHKLQINSNVEIPIIKNRNNNKYDSEERTYQFAKKNFIVLQKATNNYR
jgi:hypothetical protein